jgi:hypothetical protein
MTRRNGSGYVEAAVRRLSSSSGWRENDDKTTKGKSTPPVVSLKTLLCYCEHKSLAPRPAHCGQFVSWPGTKSRGAETVKNLSGNVLNAGAGFDPVVKATFGERIYALMESLLGCFKRSLAQRGIVNTIRLVWAMSLAKVRPAARRREAARRAADAAFDRHYGVDTGGNIRPAPESVRGGNWIFGVSYQAVDAASFMDAVNRVPIRHSEFTFIDFGAGKGRALLLAAGFLFKRIIGVEYCEELAEVARQNIRRFPTAARRCGPIEVVNADAAEFPIPTGPLVLFFFNPFGEPVMAKVVQNVVTSFRAHQRRVLVVYFTPYFDALWERTGLFRRLQASPAVFDTGPVTG